MSTSGTIGTTTVNTARIIERAVRRCGILPQKLTPEITSLAMEGLYLLLLSMSGRGLNLWCVDKQFIGLVGGKLRYSLPVGTLEVLNLLLCEPQLATGVVTSPDGTYIQDSFSTSQGVVRLAVTLATLPTSLTYQYSDDGLTWTSIALTTPTTIGEWIWYELPQQITANFHRVTGTAAGNLTGLRLVKDFREVVITQMNRDDYSSQPNKTLQSRNITSFNVEKLIAPAINLWPVPADDSRHLTLYRHRQIQDVGSLTQELELPNRWVEAIIWQLSLRLSFEIPEVDEKRRALIMTMSSPMTLEAESTETDGSPDYLAPNIGCYNA